MLELNKSSQPSTGDGIMPGFTRTPPPRGFHKIDPAVYDFGDDDRGVVSAPFTAISGLLRATGEAGVQK